MASCSADQSKSKSSVNIAEVDGNCVATAVDFERLREEFRTTAKKVAEKTTDSRVTFEDKIRPPLKPPFSEPPKVQFGVSQNPFRIDYGWSVKLSEGCKYSEVEPGYFLESVELSIYLNKDSRIIDDTIHFKIKNK